MARREKEFSLTETELISLIDAAITKSEKRITKNILDKVEAKIADRVEQSVLGELIHYLSQRYTQLNNKR